MKKIYENVLADIEAINRVAVETALDKLRPQLQESTKKELNRKLNEQIEEEEDSYDEFDTNDEDLNLDDENLEDEYLEEGEDEFNAEDSEDEFTDSDTGDNLEDDDFSELEEELEDIDNELDVDPTNELEEGEEEYVDGNTEGEEDDLELEGIIREMEGEDDEEGEKGDPASTEEDEEPKVETVTIPVTEYNSLKEAKKQLKLVQRSLTESKLLNEKLRMIDRLFEYFALTKNQKNKIVDSFDKARNLREAKMIYSALANNLKGTKTADKKSSLKEGKSSKAIQAHNKTQINENKNITKESKLVSRWKRLAKING